MAITGPEGLAEAADESASRASHGRGDDDALCWALRSRPESPDQRYRSVAVEGPFAVYGEDKGLMTLMICVLSRL